jgi:uncharacterized membrane-anchored protein
MIQRILILLGLVAALGVANYGIAARERTLREGEVVLLELRPTDPRSLMQGDYMALRFGLVDELRNDKDLPGDGYAVVTRDAHQVAHLERVQDSAEPRAAGEVPIRYRVRGGAVRVASNAWFFEEGSAKRFDSAKYAELRVDDGGAALLTGLRDESFQPL